MVNTIFPKKYIVFFVPLITAHACLGSFAECQEYLSAHTLLDDSTVRTYVQEHPSFVHARNNKRQTPLHLVTRYGCMMTTDQAREIRHDEDPQKLVLFLLAHDANPDLMDQNGFTPLHYAAGWNRPNTVCQLLVAGATITIKSRSQSQSQIFHEWVPLHNAACFGHYDIVERLIAYDRKNGSGTLNAVDADRNTPLHCAAMQGHEDVVLLLVKFGAAINAYNRNSLTPLHFAATHGLSHAVDSLLKHGAHVNAQARKNYTPLHLAAAYGHPDIILRLIEDTSSSQAGIDAESELGLTPLHLAIVHNSLSSALTLITRGADANKPDNEGVTPLEIIIFLSFLRNTPQLTQLVSKLLEHGAKTDPLGQKQYTHLEHALFRKKFPIALLLLEAKADQDIELNPASAAHSQQLVLACATFNVIRFLSRAEAYAWCYSSTGQPTEHTELQVKAAKNIMEWLNSTMINNKTVLPTELNMLIVSFLITDEAYVQLQEKPTFWQTLVAIVPRFKMSLFASQETDQGIPPDSGQIIDVGRRTFAMLSNEEVADNTMFPREINLLVLSFIVPAYAYEHAASEF